MELWSLLICLGCLVSCAQATGPLIEAEGWTPVGSPQHSGLPRGFVEQQAAERRYAAESGAANRQNWPQEEARLDAGAALVRESNDVERDPFDWQNPAAESEESVERAPLIVYPQGSPPSPADVSIDAESAAADFFLRPEPIVRRPFLPGADAPLRSPAFGQPPRVPPRFGQNVVRGQPRVRGPPLQSLPRIDAGSPASFLSLPRQLPPQFQRGGEPPLVGFAPRPQPRPRPRPAVRPRPRPRPRPHLKPSGGGLLDGIYNAGKRVECATKNALSDVRLKDKAFVQEQLNCVLDKGPCDETGRTIKYLTPEVIRGICPAPCDECTNQQIRKIMAQISVEYPRQWREILAKMSNG